MVERECVCWDPTRDELILGDWGFDSDGVFECCQVGS